MFCHLHWKVSQSNQIYHWLHWLRICRGVGATTYRKREQVIGLILIRLKVPFQYFIVPSPTKLRRDIVTLPSVLPSVRPSHPCEHSRINILQWILTKLGTYLVLKKIWNSIDFQDHRLKVKVTGSNFYSITSL